MGAPHIAECNMGTAGSPVHRNAMVRVIPWEFAIEADFQLFPYGLTMDKVLSKVLQMDLFPPSFSAAESKPCSLSFLLS